MLKRMDGWWVPFGSFGLAVLLGLAAGPSISVQAHRRQAMPSCPNVPACNIEQRENEVRVPAGPTNGDPGTVNGSYRQVAGTIGVVTNQPDPGGYSLEAFLPEFNFNNGNDVRTAILDYTFSHPVTVITDNENVTAKFDQAIEATLDYGAFPPGQEDAERGTANLYYFHQLDTFIVDLRSDSKLVIIRAGFHGSAGSVTIPPLPNKPVEGKHLKNVPNIGVTVPSQVHTENVLDACNTFSGRIFVHGNIQSQRRMQKKNIGVLPALTIRAEGKAEAVECSVGP